MDRSEGPLPPSGLLVDLLAWPERSEVCNCRPKFSWIVNGEGKDAYQTAWQILVASDERTIRDDRGDVWDSGKVVWPMSTAIAFEGTPLGPFREYFWKVRTWNGAGVASEWSKVQRFRTGDVYDSRTTSRSAPVTEQTPPERIVRKAEGHFFVDFGRTAFGYLKLDLQDLGETTSLEVRLGEKTLESESVDRSPPGSVRYHEQVVHVGPDAGVVEVRPPALPGWRLRTTGDVGEVMPFRYCEIVNCPCELDSTMVARMDVHYPFDDTASGFTCSDKTLQDIWDTCKHSIKATSFLGIYVDGDRERKPYEADAYINQLGHYATDREYTMARFTLDYLLENPTSPTEWIMQAVLLAWEDYLYTGDTRSLARNYELLVNRTLCALAREDGLISTCGDRFTAAVTESIRARGPEIRDIVDWPQGERDEYDFLPINTVVNTFHYRAVVLMSRIAGVLGRREDSGKLAERAERVRRSFNAVFRNPDTGLYVDGEGSEHSSLHANAFPLALGLVPEESRQTVAAFLKTRGMACGPYGAQFLLDGLYEAGEAEYALELMTSTGERSWAHMIYDLGATITCEAWDGRYKPNQDWNHAWGAAPANIIARRLMGVEPVEPGFARVRIRPQLGALKQAQIKVPTIRGPIEVGVETDGRSLEMTVDLPANVWASVYVPAPETDSTVRVDGAERRGRRDGVFLRFDRVGSGGHRFIRS